MTFPHRLACTAFVVTVAIVATVGCAAPAAAPPAQMTSPFSADDVAWSRAPGTAIVEGRAGVPAGGGVFQTCAGGEAQLFPAGPYAAEMMRIVFGNDVRGYVPLASSPRYPTNIAADFSRTVRRVGCDGDGRFRFDSVPAGRWYVFSNVIWRNPGGEAPTPQGGALMLRVDVAEGARANVVLTP